MVKTHYNIIVILGPTASGKTRLAARLAYRLQTEVISGDSRQVFRDMNIGTGKDYEDYVVEGKQIPHHLVDIVDAGEDYHIHQYMQDFFEVFHRLETQGKIPILCGGSGMYLDAVLKGYQFASVPVDESLRKKLETKSKEELQEMFASMPATIYTPLADISTAKRLIRAIEISAYLHKHTHEKTNYATLYPLVFGLNPSREMRRENIHIRLQQRLQQGLVEEVEKLLTNVPAEKLIRYGLEYKFVVMYLQKEISYDEMQEQLTIAIQQFAKRQMTYFRKMEREGLLIHWLDSATPIEKQLEFYIKEFAS